MNRGRADAVWRGAARATDLAAGVVGRIRENGTQQKVCRVQMYPDYTEGNPYQAELQTALEAEGISVTIADYGRWSALPGAHTAGADRPDVVHLHWLADAFVTDNAAVTAAAGVRLVTELCALRSLGVGVVWTVHNIYEHERQSPGIERAIKRIVAHLADVLVVHGDVAKDAVADAFGLSEDHRQKVITVPHGHYCNSYPNDIGREQARRSLGYDDETVFLSFGRIRQYKNVPALIDAFRELDAPDARLLVVGKPHNDRLTATVREHATGDDRVRTVLEYVPREEVQRYMNAADAVALAYDGPFASGAAVLGMSFGQAVVAPNSGFVGELLTPEGSVRYDYDSPDGLRQALRAALGNDLTAMGEHNRQRIGQFAWPRIARRTRAVYEAAAGMGHLPEDGSAMPGDGAVLRRGEVADGGRSDDRRG